MTKKERVMLIEGLTKVCADIAAIASVLEGDGPPKTDTVKTGEAEITAKEDAAKTAYAEEAQAPAATSPELETKAEPETTAEPESVPEKVYTYEEARAILAEKARTGFRAEVKAILTRHGVNQLSEVKDPVTLAAIIAEAEAISIG